MRYTQMQSVLETLKSPSWWVSVVLVGVAASLLATYLKPVLDRAGNRLSRRWAERTEARKTARTRTIEYLRSNPHEQIMLSLGELGHRTAAATLFALGTLMGLLYFAELSLGPRDAFTRGLRLVFAGGGTTCVLFAARSVIEASLKRALLRDAREGLGEGRAGDRTLS